MGGGSTGGVEYMIPGPVVNKFGRNFRQNKIVAESHPELAKSQAVGNLYADSKLPESLRHRAGPSPSKRSVDMPWATDVRRSKAQANVGRQNTAYKKRHGLSDSEMELIDDLRFSKNSPMEPMADLEKVDVSRLPKKLKKRLRKADWSEVEDYGDDFYPGSASFLAALKK